MFSEVAATPGITDEFIAFLPASELFKYSEFTKIKKSQFFKALALYTSPLLNPSEVATGKRKREEEKSAASPDKFTLSFHARQTMWSMQFYKLYFSFVIDMLLSWPYDTSRVLLNRDRIYSFDNSDRNRPVLSLELREDVRAWWRSREKTPPVIAFPMYTLNNHGDHAMFVAMKKNMLKNQMEMLYIDSGGSRGVQEDMAAFKKEVEWIFFKSVDVVPLQVVCPVLQTVEQGGNCVQWQMMFLTLLAVNPDLFDSFDDLITRLSIEPLHNLLLFQLYMFFYIDSVQENYFSDLMNIVNHEKISENDVWEFDAASGYIRDKLFPVFPVQDCTVHRTEELCNTASTCVYCNNSCVNRHVALYKKIGKTDTKRCILLSATKLYANLKELGTNFI